MKSYVKLFGPPLKDAVVALRKIALDFPEVCIMDIGIAAGLPSIGGDVSGRGELSSVDMIRAFFGGAEAISEDRCDTIISNSGESLGEYDFYYEWFKKPTVAQVEDLISKIDEALLSTGVRYTLTTK